MNANGEKVVYAVLETEEQATEVLNRLNRDYSFQIKKVMLEYSEVTIKYAEHDLEIDDDIYNYLDNRVEMLKRNLYKVECVVLLTEEENTLIYDAVTKGRKAVRPS